MTLDVIGLRGTENQPIPTNRIVASSAFQQVDNVMANCMEYKSAETALQHASDLVEAMRIAGLALAKLLYMLHEAWPELGGEAEDFEDTVMTRTGLSVVTVRKSLVVWKTILEVESQLNEDEMDLMRGRPIGDLIKVASSRERLGKKFTRPQLRKIVRSEDTRALTSYLDQLEGVDPRDSTRRLTYQLERDGTLIAWQGGESVTIGLLRNSQADRENELRRKSVDRLLDRLGVVED